MCSLVHAFYNGSPQERPENTRSLAWPARAVPRSGDGGASACERCPRPPAPVYDRGRRASGSPLRTGPLMKVRFLGVRGSTPTPGLSTVRYGGNTVWVEVRLAD